jgi:hypothetical protein
MVLPKQKRFLGFFPGKRRVKRRRVRCEIQLADEGDDRKKHHQACQGEISPQENITP